MTEPTKEPVEDVIGRLKMVRPLSPEWPPRLRRHLDDIDAIVAFAEAAIARAPDAPVAEGAALEEMQREVRRAQDKTIHYEVQCALAFYEIKDLEEVCPPAIRERFTKARERLSQSGHNKTAQQIAALSQPPESEGRAGHRKCPVCKREFRDGETCERGGCPMGGDF